MTEVELHVRMYPQRTAAQPTASIAAVVLTINVGGGGTCVTAWWHDTSNDEARRVTALRERHG